MYGSDVLFCLLYASIIQLYRLSSLKFLFTGSLYILFAIILFSIVGLFRLYIVSIGIKPINSIVTAIIIFCFLFFHMHHSTLRLL